MIFSLVRWFLLSEKENNTMEVDIEPVTRTQQQRKRIRQQVQSKECLDDKYLTSDTSDTSNYVNNNVKEDNYVDDDVKEDNDETMSKRITKSSLTPT